MISKYAELLKKLPSPIYKVAAQSYIDTKWPRHLFIETTAACNLSCDYCPREKVKNHMDYALFEKIVEEAATFGGRSFSLHLFGEPLLYPSWQQAVAFIKERHRGNTVLLTSNGTLFERYCREIVTSRIDKLIWSWRPEAKFSKETKEALRRWGKLTVRMIRGVTPEEAIKEWRDWPSVELRDLHNYGGNIAHTAPVPDVRHPCYHIFLAPAVSWNGKFLMCCSDPRKEEVFGDINSETIEECWGRLNDVRRAHLNGEYNGICSNCDVWKSYPDIFFGFQKTKSP